MFAGKKSAQIREILISESAWEEMTCLFAPSLDVDGVLGALDENEPQAKVYSQGLYTFIYYPAKGKLAVSKEGQFQGYARKIK